MVQVCYILRSSVSSTGAVTSVCMISRYWNQHKSVAGPVLLYQRVMNLRQEVQLDPECVVPEHLTPWGLCPGHGQGISSFPRMAHPPVAAGRCFMSWKRHLALHPDSALGSAFQALSPDAKPLPHPNPQNHIPCSQRRTRVPHWCPSPRHPTPWTVLEGDFSEVR